MKITKKLLWYFLFYIASTLFVFFLFRAGMAPINCEDLSKISSNFIGKEIFLPFLYSSLSLVIMVVTQTKLLTHEEKQEEFIYGCFNLLFSMMENTLGIILFALANQKASLPLLITALMIAGLGVIETAYSVYLLIDQSKKKVAENSTNDTINS